MGGGGGGVCVLVKMFTAESSNKIPEAQCLELGIPNYKYRGEILIMGFIVQELCESQGGRLGFIVQELCESQGGRPGLSVLTSLLVSVDVKNY